MADDADLAQARVFLEALNAEAVTVTAYLDDARRLAAEARTRGNNALALWHERQLKAHKRTLQEIRHQSDNLHARFPTTAE